MTFTPTYRWLLVVGCILSVTTLWAQLQSPEIFFHGRYGTWVTPHERVVDYVRHIGANSNRVKVEQYGWSSQHRPLIYAVISTPQNLSRLEEIRKNHVGVSGLPGFNYQEQSDTIAIVWLSFTVHGNEPSGTEASIRVLHDLANTASDQYLPWLKNTVVIIDPTLNPDGYARYTNWLTDMQGSAANPAPDSREHDEPWPRGRQNHYCFDLNRDWAWATQVETRQRLELYKKWLPHVHGDFHEQGYNEPYYFAPAAPPYHAYISKFQADFQKTMGLNHARYFDANGWLYFTKEIFDLFYPAYGDTYPCFNGAIGMTYEQGGNSAGGTSVILDNGDTLTLAERTLHHATAAFSTIETASKHARTLCKELTEYYRKSQNTPPGKYKSYLIKKSNDPGKVNALLDLFRLHQIQYGFAKTTKPNLPAFSFAQAKDKSVAVEAGDVVITIHQPFGLLAQVLLEPVAELKDSATYDITAWALPWAYGLDMYGLTQRIDPEERMNEKVARPIAVKSSMTVPVGFVLHKNSLQEVKALSALLAKGVVVRMSKDGFTLQGKEYPRGTLVINRGENKTLKWPADLMQWSEAAGAVLEPVFTTFADKGSDLGSERFTLLQAPKVLVLTNESVSPNSFGAVWHYLDHLIGCPHSIVHARRLTAGDLDKYNVIVLAEGRYDVQVRQEVLKAWVENGGRLIAMGAATDWLGENEGFAINGKTKSAPIDTTTKGLLLSYKDKSASGLSYSLPGIVLQCQMDQTHPFGYGMPDPYYWLKTDTRFWEVNTSTESVITTKKDPFHSGYVGYKAKTLLGNSSLMAVQSMGSGTVIYLADDPFFRGFWYQGSLLLSNLIFLPL